MEARQAGRPYPSRVSDRRVEPARAQQYRAMIAEELESAWIYEQLARAARHEATVSLLEELAESEVEHARHWAALLGDESLLVRRPGPSLRARMLVLLARVGGLGIVLPRLRTEELANIRLYQGDPEAAALVDEERAHRAALRTLLDPDQLAQAEHGFASSNAASVFRAALFGLNDGLVSNLSLVAGVAGASLEGDAVLIAGTAGLLAGAFSMGAGEYISVRSQRELLEHLLAKERMELELDPAEERQELLHIYRGKGISEETAARLVDELMADPARALDALAREELGLDPDDLASPWSAAAGSFLAFALGAIVPLLPFLIGGGYSALIAAVAGGAFALAVVGGLSSVLTGRSALFAGARMVVIGLTATGVTFGIGSVLPLD